MSRRDPGDEVLIPTPSYPLFEHLTRLDAVVPRFYDLEYHGAWSIDLETQTLATSEVARRIYGRTPEEGLAYEELLADPIGGGMIGIDPPM